MFKIVIIKNNCWPFLDLVSNDPVKTTKKFLMNFKIEKKDNFLKETKKFYFKKNMIF